MCGCNMFLSGFGDITPHTKWERYYATVVELLGTMVFGVLVGTVAELMQKKNMLEIKHDVRSSHGRVSDRRPHAQATV
jgi:hypothetical protein